MVIDDYDLHPHTVRFVNHPQRGFVGTCTYGLRPPIEAEPEEAEFALQQQILLLTRFAFYTGVGYKPAMGMGQCRCVVG